MYSGGERFTSGSVSDLDKIMRGRRDRLRPECVLYF